jgi:hypothetical protein
MRAFAYAHSQPSADFIGMQTINYASVYRLGATGPIAEFAIKKYRSHRGVCAAESSLAAAEWKAKAEAMSQWLSRAKGKGKKTAK